MPFVTNFDVKGTIVEIQDAAATQKLLEIEDDISSIHTELENGLNVTYTEKTSTISFTEGGNS